ncbi:hypothetical protein Ddye_018619 [Dipteronia dyeriana]|uniref:Uncharacterized protein n=1 Tax=Dipteronia dyeriana TaxID=168575 RepID=A0AAD9UBR7_9ROSI|nr:hypothetical protein Ddye_018619 [Dipteronia dyeriana]
MELDEIDLEATDFGSSVLLKKIPNGLCLQGFAHRRLTFLLIDSGRVNVNARDHWDTIAHYYDCLASQFDVARMLFESGTIRSYHTFDSDKCNSQAIEVDLVEEAGLSPKSTYEIMGNVEKDSKNNFHGSRCGYGQSYFTDPCFSLLLNLYVSAALACTPCMDPTLHYRYFELLMHAIEANDKENISILESIIWGRFHGYVLSSQPITLNVDYSMVNPEFVLSSANPLGSTFVGVYSDMSKTIRQTSRASPKEKVRLANNLKIVLQTLKMKDVSRERRARMLRKAAAHQVA